MKWRLPQIRKRFQYVPGLYTFRIAALVVLCAGLLITGLLWASSRQRINQDAFKNFSDMSNELNDTVTQRMSTYEEILRGGVGLFSATHGDVSHDEWHNFIQNYDVMRRYPGFAGIGFAKLLHPDEVDSYVQYIRDSYYPSYTITPEGSRDTYVAVAYSENTTNSVRGLGVDMYPEPRRREALDMARDLGDATMTNRVQSLVDKNIQQASFIMFLPVYKPGMATQTLTERRAAIDGYVYASFRMGNLINAVSPDINNGKFGLALYSGDTTNEEESLYKTNNYGDLIKDPYTITRTTTVRLPGKVWTAVYRAQPASFISTNDAKRPLLTVISGIIFSITLASFLYMLMLSRARYISRTQQLEVQRAKDDLLSLASHQLRTPATGVKQYIGMVLQGYVGEVDAEQRSMLDKAYESNERQLETINQILYVTKADAGRLKLTKSRFDIVEMVRDVVAEQSDSINKRGQKVKYKLNTRKQIVHADRQYVRMAVENLISNASKYSYENSRITIETNVKGSKLYLAVRDEGVGIAEEDIQKLFGKFSRIDNDLSVKAGGSGIGLYLSKQVAKLHHGDIVVSSVLHHGSTFTLILPLKKSDQK